MYCGCNRSVIGERVFERTLAFVSGFLKAMRAPGRREEESNGRILQEIESVICLFKARLNKLVIFSEMPRHVIEKNS